MGLITPEIGLVFWTTLSFLIVLFILAKFAWKPMLKALKDREESIEGALAQAEQARAEMSNLQSENERLLREARVERDQMLSEARQTRDSIVEKAEEGAKERVERMVASAREEIQNERLAAVTDMKNMVAQLSIDIAEKIVKKELSSNEDHTALLNNLIDEVNLN